MNGASAFDHQNLSFAWTHLCSLLLWRFVQNVSISVLPVVLLSPLMRYLGSRDQDARCGKCLDAMHQGGRD